MGIPDLKISGSTVMHNHAYHNAQPCTLIFSNFGSYFYGSSSSTNNKGTSDIDGSNTIKSNENNNV